MTNTYIELAHFHNLKVDEFINVDLALHFGSDKITPAQWFEAQNLIAEQKFYERGRAIQKILRDMGVDCKMDMQSNKLHCPEVGLNAY